MKSYINVLAYVSIFSVLIPLVTYLTSSRRVNKPIHIIGMLVAISGLCDMIAWFLVTQNLSTALLGNIFFVVQFCLLSYYYYETFFRDKYDVILIITVMHFFLAFLIDTYFYQNLMEEHQNLVWLVSSLMLIVYGIFFARKIQNGNRPIYTIGHFWINGATLFYLSASLWIFAISSNSITLKIGKELSQFIWSFYDANNVIKNVLYAAGIYYASQPPAINSGLSQIPKQRVNSDKILAE